MNDDQVQMFLDDKGAEQYPEVQTAFNEFAQARRALTFLSVSEKSLKEMDGLPQYIKNGVQSQETTDNISDGQ